MKKIKDILTPKKEVTSEDQFQSVIHTHKVGQDKDGLENNPKRFFKSTYPSNAIKNVLDAINSKLKHKTNNGGFILNGPRGSGKSHALVALYYLFKNFDIASEWLDTWNIDFRTIEDNKSAIVSTQEIDADYIWEPIFHRLGKEEYLSEVKRYPETGLIEEIVEDGSTAIFLDELETWWKTIKNDEEKKHKNEYFLQNLLEVANG